MGYKFNPFTGQLDIASSSSSSSSPSNIVTLSVNENISATKIVAASGYLADKDSSTNHKAIGIAIQSISSSGSVQVDGVFEDASFSFTPNSVLYLGNNGNITHTAPTSGYRVKVGIALTTTSFKLELQSERITIA